MKSKLKNRFEKSLYSQLKRAKVTFKYESEKIPYILARHYIPDFVVVRGSEKIYIEAKGYLRPEHKAKMVAVKKLHPAMDIRIVFYSENKRNIRWAEKHGFAWAVGKIPKEWLASTSPLLDSVPQSFYSPSAAGTQATSLA